MPETFIGYALKDLSCCMGKIYNLTPGRSIILHPHPLRQIPLVHSVHPFLYINLMMPAQPVQFAYIRQLTHSTVRFRSVKSQFTLIAHFLDNLVRQLGNGNFFSRTDVDVTVADILGAGSVCILKVHMLHDIDWHPPSPHSIKTHARACLSPTKSLPGR